MLSLFVPNIVLTVAVVSILITAPLGIALQIIGVAALSVALFAFGNNAARIADFKSASLKEYFAEFPKVWKDGVLFALIVAVLFLLGFFGIPFYMGMQSLFGLFLAALVFWFLLVCAMALQWFIPIRSLLKDNFRKCLKKSFIIFFDNPGFSLFMFIYSIILLALSIFLFFMMPGFAGILLAHTNGLRLRLYKYDWLEENPDLSAKERKHVPWGELIAEDQDTLGPRSFKSFIFPWK